MAAITKLGSGAGPGSMMFCTKYQPSIRPVIVRMRPMAFDMPVSHP
jgi:hypothetical protein